MPACQLGKVMDLIEALRKAIELLKSNLILFLPPLILAYLLPTALALAGLYIFAPVLVAAANSPAPLTVFGVGLLIAGLWVVVLALLAYAYVLAGWAGMNKNATITGNTTFNDFWSGAKAYFGRMLGAIVLLAVIYIVLVVLGLAATFAVFLPLLMRFIPSGIVPGGLPFFPGGTPQISQIVASIGNTIGVWLIVLTLAGLVFLFTLFWVQSVALDDVGPFGALSRSISFVRNNFKTTLGLTALYIIATAFTGQIFPGGGGGGGGGAGNGAFSFTMIIPAPLEAIFRLLITTFFMLYTFVVYADRTGKTLASTTSPETVRRIRKPARSAR